MNVKSSPLRVRVAGLLTSISAEEGASFELRREAIACLEEMSASATAGQGPCGSEDPHEMRMAQLRLSACEATLSQLEQIFDSVADAVCVADITKEIFKVNTRFSQLVGKTKHEIVGCACSEVLGHICCHCGACVLQRIIGGEELVEQQLDWRTDNGESRAFLLTARAFKGSGGELVGAILSFRDVHDFKKMEKHLSETRKLESLGQLAEGLAHEINTPCQFLGSNLEFLSTSCAELLELTGAKTSGQPLPQDIDISFLREEIPSAISQSQAGVVRIAKITRAMRAFAEPPTTKPMLGDLKTVVEDTVTLSTPIWEPHASVIVRGDDSLPAVPVFGAELGQALLALLTNAAEAIARRGIQGHIDIELLVADDRFVEIRISDNGDGIDPKNASKVFDMFFTTKPEGQSLGHGLSMVHAFIVAHHRGSVDHRPGPEGGTVFTLRLPM